MKKQFFLTAFILLLFSCSKSDPDKKVGIVESVSPTKAKIGDTISIKGKDLGAINTIKFEVKDVSKVSDLFNIISHTENEIRVVVPELTHEKVSIVTNADNKILALDLVGFIPTTMPFTDPKFRNIRLVNAPTERVAYLVSEGNNKLRKSVDGYYNWDTVYDFSSDEPISALFFLNEDIGWVTTSHKISSHRKVYFTGDGGHTFILKHEFDYRSYGNIISMNFISENKGVLIDTDGTVFIVNGDSFSNIYDVYPGLADVSKVENGFGYVKMLDNGIIFLANGDHPYLIKIENKNISSSQLQLWPRSLKFFKNEGFLSDGRKIYKTTDYGNSWAEIYNFTSDNSAVPSITFYTPNDAIAAFGFYGNDSAKVLATTDGGKTWKKYITFNSNENPEKSDFNKNSGILLTYVIDQRIYKFIKP